eukprot:9470104-Pyramimonas_sp.AAC.1
MPAVLFCAGFWSLSGAWTWHVLFNLSWGLAHSSSSPTQVGVGIAAVILAWLLALGIMYYTAVGLKAVHVTKRLLR